MTILYLVSCIFLILGVWQIYKERDGEILLILVLQQKYVKYGQYNFYAYFAIKCKTKHNFVSQSLTLMVHLTIGHFLMTGLDYRYNIPQCLIICGTPLICYHILPIESFNVFIVQFHENFNQCYVYVFLFMITFENIRHYTDGILSILYPSTATLLNV